MKYAARSVIPICLAIGVAVLSIQGFTGQALAAGHLGEATASTKPVLKDGRAKWRIAYVQGGDYPYYAKVLAALARGLSELGWTDPLSEQNLFAGDDPAALWTFLSQEARGGCVEFVSDAFWSAGWNKDARAPLRERIAARLAKGDIDAVLALGTWAGQDMAQVDTKTPVFVLQSSDPVAAGIVQSAADSGRDNLFAHCDPDRYKRQMRIFHQVVGFSRLGVAFEDSAMGRVYAAINDLHSVAAERGFELVACNAKNLSQGEKGSVASYFACYQYLASHADAVCIAHGATQTKYFRDLISPLMQAKIPTFAQGGSLMVRRGALLSMAQTEFRIVGRFYADALARVFRGASPRSLPQVFEDPPVIAVNLKTAKLIGFTFPMDILGAAGEIFTDIDTGDVN